MRTSIVGEQTSEGEGTWAQLRMAELLHAAGAWRAPLGFAAPVWLSQRSTVEGQLRELLRADESRSVEGWHSYSTLKGRLYYREMSGGIEWYEVRRNGAQTAPAFRAVLKSFIAAGDALPE